MPPFTDGLSLGRDVSLFDSGLLLQEREDSIHRRYWRPFVSAGQRHSHEQVNRSPSRVQQTREREIEESKYAVLQGCRHHKPLGRLVAAFYLPSVVITLVRIESLALIVIGGFAGLNLRYFTEFLVPGLYGTLLINVLGSFAFGFITFLGTGTTFLFLFGTGVCGSFTTFSLFSFETVRLCRRKHSRVIRNAGGNLIGAGIAIGLTWGLV